MHHVVILIATLAIACGGWCSRDERWATLFAVVAALWVARLSAATTDEVHLPVRLRARALAVGALGVLVTATSIWLVLPHVFDDRNYPERLPLTLERLPLDVACVLVIGAALLAAPAGVVRDAIGRAPTAPAAMASLLLTPWFLSWNLRAAVITHYGCHYDMVGWGRLLLLGAVFGACAFLALGSRPRPGSTEVRRTGIIDLVLGAVCVVSILALVPYLVGLATIGLMGALHARARARRGEPWSAGALATIVGLAVGLVVTACAAELRLARMEWAPMLVSPAIAVGASCGSATALATMLLARGPAPEASR